MSTEGFHDESFSDEGLSAEQSATNRKRKLVKKEKNQKRRARKKLKKKLAKSKACFRCGREFCGCNRPFGSCGQNKCDLAVEVGATCGCQVCNFCFIRNFVGAATRCESGDWRVPCPGGCGNNYLVPAPCVEWCAGSIGDLATVFFK